MNDITKKELQEIQEQLESIMQYGLADKLQNIIDDNSIPVDKPVKPDFAEITLEDYDKLGDTFIDCKNDSPLTQWRIIAGMLSSIGFKIIKKQ